MNISDYRLFARENLAGKWGKAILAALIAAVFGALLVGASLSLSVEVDERIIKYIPQFILKYLSITAKIGTFLAFVQFVVGGAVQLGYCRFLLNMEDGNEAKLSDLFSEFDRFWDAFLLNLLSTLYVFLWSLLFVIPGIVAAYRYAMAPFIMLENPQLSPNEAITESKELMYGNKGSLFLLDLSFIGWILLSALTLGIGYLWLNPYMNAAHAAFYRNINPHTPIKPFRTPMHEEQTYEAADL